jgi:hypothetical protein
MESSELGTRCAWCTRVKDGADWVEATSAQAPGQSGELLWSHGICPECSGAFGFVQAPNGANDFTVTDVRARP